MTKSSRSGRPVHQRRPRDDQRDAHRAGHHRQRVEHERQGTGRDDPPVAAEAVHDRDGVDEDVERAGARPEGEDEPDRDDVVASPVEHLLQGRRDDPVDGPVGQGRRGEVEDGVAHVVDLGRGEPLADEAHRAGEGEDERRDGQHREERSLGGEPGHPVPQARPDGRDDDAPEVLAPAPRSTAAAGGVSRAPRPCGHVSTGCTEGPDLRGGSTGDVVLVTPVALPWAP